MSALPRQSSPALLTTKIIQFKNKNRPNNVTTSPFSFLTLYPVVARNDLNRTKPLVIVFNLKATNCFALRLQFGAE